MLSDLETGRKSTSRENIGHLDAALNAGGALIQAWESASDGQVAPWFRGVAESQRTSDALRVFQPLIIPGLLQIAEYARTLVRVSNEKFSDSEVEEVVSGRIERHSILDSENPPKFIAVINEEAIRRPMGPHEIMSRQITHLEEVAQRPRVSIEIIPAYCPLHPGLDGGFQIIDVAAQGQIIYLETKESGYPYSDSATVEKFTALFGDLRGLALPPNSSLALMREIRREFND